MLRILIPYFIYMWISHNFMYSEEDIIIALKFYNHVELL